MSASATTRSDRAGRAPPFEIAESKLRAPRVGARSVLRARLVGRLNRATSPVLVLSAGPGYGKTTALAQWAASPGSRPFAWVSLDRQDNDPVVLLTYIAVALDRISPIDPKVFEALGSQGASIEATVGPRLGGALSAMDRPVVLVLDDLQAIENPRCIDAVVALVGHLGENSQLVLSARDRSALPLGLLRTRDLLAEFGPDDLRMEPVEARSLLSATGLEISDDDLADLVRHTEGWPAGLYLAALSAGSTGLGPRQLGAFTGNDPFVADFLGSEFLARLPADELRFLRRTSILEQLSGPLCDAVLESHGSASLLESLERSNSFVVALDRDRRWYRFHGLVGELLAGELARSEPQLIGPLLRRASDWCAANDQPIAAIGYAQAAGDTDRVATAMERWIMPVFQSGRAATVEQWLDWLQGHDGMRRYPAVAVIGAMFHSVTGRPAASDRWADAAMHGERVGHLPDGSSSIESWRALLRAFRCIEGMDVMRADAALALSTLAPESPWRPVAGILLGLAELLCGGVDAADDLFAQGAEEAAQLGAPDMVPVALAERAIVAIARDQWAAADEFAERAVWSARHSGREDAAINGLVYAVAARTALHAGRDSAADELQPKAQRRLPELTYVLPIPSVQTRLQLARTYLTRDDRAGARTMLREIEAMLRRRPDLGILSDDVADLRSRLTSAEHNTPGVTSLTAAELRVLPFLTTHLTFKEIGQRAYLSLHTVKSHAMSIYRKLGVTSRGAAVDRARAIGLL